MSQINHSDLAASLSPEVLALLAASYGRSADKVVATIVTRSENPKPRKASKLAAVKAAAIEQSEAHPVTPENQKPMVCIELPPVGTLDAKGFLIAMRRATTRDESIKAIAGYCGYDRHGDHGAQDLAARMRAQRELRGAPKALAAPVHTGHVSVKGYVHGMPDAVAAKVGDLLGRERIAAENLAHLDAIVKGEGTDENVKAIAEAFGFDARIVPSVAASLVGIETARLNQIRADLATLTG